MTMTPKHERQDLMISDIGVFELGYSLSASRAYHAINLSFMNKCRLCSPAGSNAYCNG